MSRRTIDPPPPDDSPPPDPPTSDKQKRQQNAAILTEVRKRARMLDRRERAADRARDDLKDIIRGALAMGVTTRRLADAAGVSQPRIVQIGKSDGPRREAGGGRE